MLHSPIVIAVYCDDEHALTNTCLLAESLRAFGGRLSACPIRAYAPSEAKFGNPSVLEKATTLGIDRRTVETPESVRWLYYAAKPFAAAKAEADLDGSAETLIFMDDDTVILDEPRELELTGHVSLAYVPVMHNRAGSSLGTPPDELWARVYELFGIRDEQLLPMVTPVDRQKIRAYFHCGLLAVRPELGIMRAWADSFVKLAEDARVEELCRDDRTRKVFLHQHALTGPILHTLDRSQMLELPERYNYPVFFEKIYDSPRPYNSLESVVTMRRVVPLSKVGADWPEQLHGPSDRITWLKDHWV